MANQWFKFYGGEYLSDPKIDRLTSQERSCWLTLLCMASMTDDGVINFLSTESLLKKSGIEFNPYDSTEWDNTKKVLQTLSDLKMIKVSDDGSVTLLNWEKRQESFLSNAERQAKYRENKKKVTPVTTKVTLEENRIEKKRIEENREESTPSDKAQEFFNNQESQLKVIEVLVEKGLPQNLAEREIKKFVAYWTELNKSGTKQRWELEKTFEVQRRLTTWFSKINEFQKSKNIGVIKV